MATVNSCLSLAQTLIHPIPFTTSSSHPNPSFPAVSVAILRHGLPRRLIRTLSESFSVSTHLYDSKQAIWCCSSPNLHPVEPGLFSLFQKIGLGEKDSEALFCKNPALLRASPSSISSRFQSLQSIGIANTALSHLVIKRPELLTEEFNGFLKFVQENLKGINVEKLERLFLATEPQNLLGFPDKVTLLVDHGIPPDKLVFVLNSINLKKLFSKQSEEINRLIDFLKNYDNDHESCSFILRRPSVLNIDLEKDLIPRTRFLLGLGGGDENSVKSLLNRYPAILAYTVKHQEAYAAFWRSVGLKNEEIFKILQACPSIISVSKERKLQPRVEFLKKCGLNKTEIFRLLIKAPLFLSLSFEENLSKKLGFLLKIGYRNNTKELALAIGAVTRTSSENLQMVITVLMNYGFGCEDLLLMSKKHPQILQYNHRSLELKIKYLIEEMDRNIQELLSFPAYLGYKLDDRIKLRYELRLRMKNKSGEVSQSNQGSINKLLSMSTKKFLNKNASAIFAVCDEHREENSLV